MARCKLGRPVMWALEMSSPGRADHHGHARRSVHRRQVLGQPSIREDGSRGGNSCRRHFRTEKDRARQRPGRERIDLTAVIPQIQNPGDRPGFFVAVFFVYQAERPLTAEFSLFKAVGAVSLGRSGLHRSRAGNDPCAPTERTTTMKRLLSAGMALTLLGGTAATAAPFHHGPFHSRTPMCTQRRIS